MTTTKARTVVVALTPDEAQDIALLLHSEAYDWTSAPDSSRAGELDALADRILGAIPADEATA